MKWHTARAIDRIAIPITRACNRRCPECPAVERPEIYGKGPRNPHVSIEELAWVGKTLGPIGKVEITGGEPSIHPDFAEISKRIHELFQCRTAMLLTNGFRFRDPESLPLFLHYDEVYVTHYTPTFAARYKTTPNTDIHDKIREFLLAQTKTKLWSQVMDFHHPIDAEPSKGPTNCFYYTCDSVGYSRGQIYGCCVAHGLPYRGRGIVLTKEWREELASIELPCETCYLSGL